jgi:hypothetical protein
VPAGADAEDGVQPGDREDLGNGGPDLAQPQPPAAGAESLSEPEQQPQRGAGHELDVPEVHEQGVPAEPVGQPEELLGEGLGV